VGPPFARLIAHPEKEGPVKGRVVRRLKRGKSQKEVIRPDFNKAIMIDFQGAQISSDTGVILFSLDYAAKNNRGGKKEV
jgi:hypothetical protein